MSKVRKALSAIKLLYYPQLSVSVGSGDLMEQKDVTKMNVLEEFVEGP